MVVSIAGIFAGNRHNIADAAAAGRQKIGLQGNPVAVAAAYLYDGLQPLPLQDHGGTQ